VSFAVDQLLLPSARLLTPRLRLLVGQMSTCQYVDIILLADNVLLKLPVMYCKSIKKHVDRHLVKLRICRLNRCSPPTPEESSASSFFFVFKMGYVSASGSTTCNLRLLVQATFHMSYFGPGMNKKVEEL
jgi:hypothetical protein